MREPKPFVALRSTRDLHCSRPDLWRRCCAWMLAAASALAAGACTSYAVGVQHDRAQLQKISQVAVQWVPKDDIQIHVQRSDPTAETPIYGKDGKPVQPVAVYRPPPVVSEADKRTAAAHLRSIMGLYRAQVEDRLGQALRERAVAVRPAGDASVPVLRITPTHGHTTCVPLGCTDSLWLEVQVRVGSDAKPAWSARIRSATSWPQPISDAMVTEFVDTLLRNLKDSALL